MSRFQFILFLFVLLPVNVLSQSGKAKVDSFWLHGDIKITIDNPLKFKLSDETIIAFYALPNGNSTEQTMGRRIHAEDDWHYDIQHIRAQTNFLRQQLKHKNFVVIYLENNLKSWPAWKQKHTDFKSILPQLVDSLVGLVQGKQKSIYLNGHSGGGSFIFGYLAGVDQIPTTIKRISFLDSDYGYDSTYYSKFLHWLKEVSGASLNVFAYNDSIALYNGKPFVSATGGTWYRSWLLLKHLQNNFTFARTITDSLVIFKSDDKRIQFYFKPNLDSGIYHTKQVELNGFIHSVLCGTKYDSRKYTYYSSRAYSKFIE